MTETPRLRSPTYTSLRDATILLRECVHTGTDRVRRTPGGRYTRVSLSWFRPPISTLKTFPSISSVLPSERKEFLDTYTKTLIDLRPNLYVHTERTYTHVLPRT